MCLQASAIYKKEGYALYPNCRTWFSRPVPLLSRTNFLSNNNSIKGRNRPISLIHGIAKIISKLLALRLAPHMNTLISTSQSAFIKGRSIHDNFLYVHNLVRKLHANKTPAFFIKLDITKAFDSVRWDYLLSLLQHMGFPPRWCGWLAAALSSSSSSVLLNGIPLPPIQHGRGLRQGDPLSPLLFILAFDPLHRLLQIATDKGHLTKLGGRTADSASLCMLTTRQYSSNQHARMHTT